MVVIVTGDRHWKNEAKIAKQLLKRRKKIKLLIQGGAKGADTIANMRAQLLGIPCVTAEANWSKFGPAAGPIRNSLMLKLALAYAKATKDTVLVLAFHSNLKKSKGTAHMVKIAKTKKLKVRLFK
jgi:7-cyano-7-deazaguanine synthase in queuosine biosynthesis